MQCERLIRQIKSWYIHVSNETMAPARMVSFIEEHALDCSICRQDPDLQEEIEKITEMVLPESKIPKAVRMQQEQEKMELEAAAQEREEEETETTEEAEETEETEEATETEVTEETEETEETTITDEENHDKTT